MSVRLRRNWDLLKVLKSGTPDQRKALIKASSNDLILAICEIVDNVLRGTVKLTPTQRKKLQSYKGQLRKLASKNVAPKEKRKVLVSQKGGFLPLVLAPALGLIGSLVGDVIGKAIK